MSNFQTFELWVSIYSVRANFGPAAAGSAGPVPTPLLTKLKLIATMSYLRVNTVPPNTINMAIVNDGEVVWSHKHTIQFRKMINIGKKLIKITVEHNSTEDLL